VFWREALAELAAAQPLSGNAFETLLGRTPLVRMLLDLLEEDRP